MGKGQEYLDRRDGAGPAAAGRVERCLREVGGALWKFWSKRVGGLELNTEEQQPWSTEHSKFRSKKKKKDKKLQ